MVTVYSKPGCGGCIATKRFLKKNSVDFTEINVYEDEEAMDRVVNTLGYKQMPVVETPQDHWSGYKEDKLKSLV